MSVHTVYNEAFVAMFKQEFYELVVFLLYRMHETVYRIVVDCV